MPSRSSRSTIAPRRRSCSGASRSAMHAPRGSSTSSRRAATSGRSTARTRARSSAATAGGARARPGRRRGRRGRRVTTREHARPAGTPGRDGDGGRGREPRTPPPGERLADRLVAAREARGIDLLRAERETKIRRQYLAAMERGAWEELPAGVYARGFLRNYAIYLGLDPDEVLAAWNRERGEVPVEPSIVVPRPIDGAPPRDRPRSRHRRGGARLPGRGRDRRLHRLPAPALLRAPAAGRHRSAHGRHGGRGGDDLVHPAGHDRGQRRGDDQGPGAPGRARDRRRQRRLAHRRRPSARREPLRRDGRRPGHRQGGRDPGRDRDHRALRPGRRADPGADLAGGRPQRRERGDPGARDDNGRDVGQRLGRLPRDGARPARPRVSRADPSGDPGGGCRAGRRRELRDGRRPDRGPLGDHRDGGGRAGQVHDADPERDRRLPGSQRRRRDPRPAHVAQGLGRRRRVARHRGRRQGLRRRQDAHLPGPGVRRDPDGQDEHDLRHRQRDGVRRPGHHGQPRHVPPRGRASRRRRRTEAAVAAAELRALVERAPGRLPGRGAPRRGRRVLHRRPGRRRADGRRRAPPATWRGA